MVVGTLARRRGEIDDFSFDRPQKKPDSLKGSVVLPFEVCELFWLAVLASYDGREVGSSSTGIKALSELLLGFAFRWTAASWRS